MKIKGLYLKRGWYYYQGGTVNGVRPPAVALKTQDHAVAVEKTFALHERNALHKQSKGRMSDLLAEYLAWARASRIHTDKTSHVTRLTLERLVKDWGDPAVVRIDRKKVEAWRGALYERKGLVGEKMSEASVSSYLRRLSGFLTWLVREKHLRDHPMREIRLGRVKKTRRDKFCSVEQREKLLEDVPSAEIELILHLGFFAGLRFGEMLAMQDDWISHKSDGGMVLTVQESPVWKPKDVECRSIEVHPRLAAVLHHSLGRGPFVLAPYRKVWKNPPAYRFNPKKAFKTHAEACGVGWVTYHTLRHSFATHLAMKGAMMIEIAHALGDSLRVTEETYVGFSPASKTMIGSI